jgi:hypothetical protein
MIDWLCGRELGGKVVLDSAGKAAIEAYLAEHGGIEG